MLRRTIQAILVAAAAALAIAPPQVMAQDVTAPAIRDAFSRAASANNLGAALASFPNPRRIIARETGTSSTLQRFEGGTIYSHSVRVPNVGLQEKMFVVHGTILARYDELQMHDSRLGLPVSDEIACLQPKGDRFQRYERGIMYWQVDQDYARPLYGSGTVWQDRNCNPSRAGNNSPSTPQKTPPPGTFLPKFRVTLLGFQADEQTDDTMLQTDGKGDEIFLLTHVARYDFATPTVNRYRTVLMGDVNDQPAQPERMLVGDLSDQGGIGTGFRFLPRNPTRGAYRGLTLPLVVYEGYGPVMVVPTIWEWDGDDKFARNYDRQVDELFLKGPVTISFVRDGVAGRLDPAVDPGPVFPSSRLNWQATVGGFQRGGSDRAIGQGEYGDEWVFAPQFLFLTGTTAAQVARTSGNFPALRTRESDGPYVEPLYPRSLLQGMVNVRYTPPVNKKGAYTLFLKVEMVP